MNILVEIKCKIKVINVPFFVTEKGDALPTQTDHMDAESADMLAALRRQIQPHLMMAALTPSRIPGVHVPPSPAQMNYAIPLTNFLPMPVSAI